ncbi:unnamed protein product [Oppiella nova]|uniref:Uncharacterized protein n=1 Tax=Oppiella nova TaxID=334625 RepID=A0A7R9LKR6_9ACAR|nr:unnamed protein product [Oppiella nova]CAG2164618.1 unnamed protein product [Oppiella nova]
MDCEKCIGVKGCAFWYCGSEGIGPKPLATTIPTIATTTDTSPSTITTTIHHSSTMLKSTTEQTTSTQHETSTTSKPTAPTSTELNPKDPETNRKLTGWTIAVKEWSTTGLTARFTTTPLTLCPYGSSGKGSAFGGQCNTSESEGVVDHWTDRTVHCNQTDSGVVFHIIISDFVVKY